jgi:hypothetical protein
VPAEQRLWCHDGCHFGQHLCSEQPGLYCQTAALIIGEAKPSAAKLSTKDSVFLPQILDCVLLLLIHPAGNREEQKAERIQCSRHRFSSLTPLTCAVVDSSCFARAFNQFQFLDITGWKRRRNSA